jgi:thioredoxin 1
MSQESIDLPNVIYLGSKTWCQACKVALPVIQRCCEELSIPLTEVDCDTDPKTAAAYNASSLPTVIVEKYGQEAYRWEGAYPAKRVLELLKKANSL